MDQFVEIDRVAIRGMVEDFWRSFLVVAQSSPQIGLDTISRFDERIQSMASMMPPDQSKVFLEVVDIEREALFNEYKSDPTALKARLGLPSDSGYNAPRASHQRQTLGEVAAKTAVRATIWEIIGALFR